MISIVVVHAWYIFGSTNSNLDTALVTPFKFATIAFFLISGFLMGERVDRRNPVEYFMRRFRKVFVPWLLWFGVFATALVIYQLAAHRSEFSSSTQILWTAFSTSRNALYQSSFWFVPNLLVCMAILLMCRRYIYTLKLGAVLLTANLVYVANIYGQWFPSDHSRAIFGFVFYLWLGSYVAQNFDKISKVLALIPAKVFVATSIVTGVAAYFESHLLAVLNCADPLNSLRLTNQVFSISMVLMIFKFSRATWPTFIDVRRHTFGIYLAHCVILRPFLHLSKNSRFHWAYAGNAKGILLWIAVSTVTYLSALTITIWLAKRPSRQWIVGLAPDASTPSLNADDALALSRPAR
jgi:membrane-bound acyltransferase YfiQ involved in biofilm formation